MTKVTHDFVSIKVWSRPAGSGPAIATTETLPRPNVLRVADGLKPFDIVYSGRSSWADVRALPSNSGERVRVTTLTGLRFQAKCNQVKTSDTEITVISKGGPVHIPKNNVSQIFYVREKPWSDSAMYAAQEMGVLDPELWPSLLHIVKRVPVLLYDSSKPEDNTPIRCKNDPDRLVRSAP